MIIQLENTRQEILHTVEDIPEHLFNERENEQTWSVGQVLEHLHKTEVEITKAIKYMLTLPEQEPLPDQPLKLTLDRSIKRMAPAAITPAIVVNKNDILHALSQSRNQLLQLIDSIPPEQDLTTRGFKHPVFPILSIKQWIEFVGYHEQRHLAQIFEIKQFITNESV
ncbi:DinB family protein [Metabacillus litoralis]|uniref:DinB family protein n=1 Tax=Metabacillus litoralis TaxID=152268 RepID=UPI00203EBC70|nr:DinB family protein [Metabacillus litoralis]MCM3160953.1 DinB family protein [Metabacillus litoralis]